MHSGSTPIPMNVTIIGAGLAGLALALALYDKGISCVIHELRPSSFSMGGAIMLSPNALRVPDSIGKPESIYQRVQNKGFNFDTLSFLNDQHEVKDTYCFGQKERYGYHGLRIYRQVLIEEMLHMIRERGVPIHNERKFSHIVAEDEGGVAFAMADGKELYADILVGADGIHSTVRKHIEDVRPTFSGLLAITSAIPLARRGAFVIAPQDVDGSELLIGTQRPHPVLDREGWVALSRDKAKLIDMLTENKESWSDIVQSALEAARLEKLNIWPYYTIPKLESWKSKDGRVVILGDAAHAIPPSAGQGVNQAFEDSFSLAILLSGTGTNHALLGRSLEFWQSWRQSRIDRVSGLTQLMNNKRLPEERRKNVQADVVEDPEGQLAWLYQPKLEEEILAWLELHA